MANVIQVLEDSARNYVIKITGTAPDVTALIVDVSALATPCVRVRLNEIQYDVGPGTTATLLWDATTDVTLITLTEGPGQTLCFRHLGGINNPNAAGSTGDVLLTTTGTAIYTIVAWFVKKYN